VRAKAALNRSILDQGWFEFRRLLSYKLAWSGGILVAVQAKNTSRTCPACGSVSVDNRQTQMRFACVVCRFEANADHVGAINVLTAGHARLACQASGAVIPPATGTHRSDLKLALCQLRAPKESPILQDGEDVKPRALECAFAQDKERMKCPTLHC
jgi:putative transposase